MKKCYSNGKIQTMRIFSNFLIFETFFLFSSNKKHHLFSRKNEVYFVYYSENSPIQIFLQKFYKKIPFDFKKMTKVISAKTRENWRFRNPKQKS